MLLATLSMFVGTSTVNAQTTTTIEDFSGDLSAYRQTVLLDDNGGGSNDTLFSINDAGAFQIVVKRQKASSKRTLCWCQPYGRSHHQTVVWSSVAVACLGRTLAKPVATALACLSAPLAETSCFLASTHTPPLTPARITFLSRTS